MLGGGDGWRPYYHIGNLSWVFGKSMIVHCWWYCGTQNRHLISGLERTWAWPSHPHYAEKCYERKFVGIAWWQSNLANSHHNERQIKSKMIQTKGMNCLSSDAKLNELFKNLINQFCFCKNSILSIYKYNTFFNNKTLKMEEYFFLNYLIILRVICSKITTGGLTHWVWWQFNSSAVDVISFVAIL